jgi:hypothetical protein
VCSAAAESTVGRQRRGHRYRMGTLRCRGGHASGYSPDERCRSAESRGPCRVPRALQPTARTGPSAAFAVRIQRHPPVPGEINLARLRVADRFGGLIHEYRTIARTGQMDSRHARDSPAPVKGGVSLPWQQAVQPLDESSRSRRPGGQAKSGTQFANAANYGRLARLLASRQPALFARPRREI